MDSTRIIITIGNASATLPDVIESALFQSTPADVCVIYPDERRARRSLSQYESDSRVCLIELGGRPCDVDMRNLALLLMPFGKILFLGDRQLLYADALERLNRIREDGAEADFAVGQMSSMSADRLASWREPLVLFERRVFATIGGFRRVPAPTLEACERAQAAGLRYVCDRAEVACTIRESAAGERSEAVEATPGERELMATQAWGVGCTPVSAPMTEINKVSRPETIRLNRDLPTQNATLASVAAALPAACAAAAPRFERYGVRT